jgi:predicted DNA-binding transcriptional regulator AlpA
MTDPQELNELLKPIEVARTLRISLRTLAKWRQHGKGPSCIRLGYNRIVYRRQAVDEWLSRKGAL